MKRLPFAVESVTLENFRGFASITCSLAPATVVIAPNGAGKSSILEGIALGLTNLVTAFGGTAVHLDEGDVHRTARGFAFEEVWPLLARLDVKSHEPLGTLTGTWGLRWAAFNKSEPLHAPTVGVEVLPLLCVFKSPRRSRSSPIERQIARVMATQRPRSAGYDRWWNAEPDLSSVAAWVLRQQMLPDRIGGPALDFFQSALRRTKLFNEIAFDVAANALVAETSDGRRVRSVDLSEGHKTVLSIIGDIVLRASQLNPDTDPSLIAGTVLIDEIDEHLHPAMAQDILPLLVETFPNLQWIVSSHSPQVWQSAPEGAVHSIAIDSNGIGSLTTLDFTEGAEAQLLLGRVNVADRPPQTRVARVIRAFEEHLAARTETSDEALALLDELSELTGGRDPELVRLRGAAKLVAYKRARSQ